MTASPRCDEIGAPHLLSHLSGDPTGQIHLEISLTRCLYDRATFNVMSFYFILIEVQLMDAML